MQTSNSSDRLQSRDVPRSTYNEDNMVYSINDLFLGGSETTSTTLNWGLLYMVANPDVQGEWKSTCIGFVSGRVSVVGEETAGIAPLRSLEKVHQLQVGPTSGQG